MPKYAVRVVTSGQYDLLELHEDSFKDKYYVTIATFRDHFDADKVARMLNKAVEADALVQEDTTAPHARGG